MNTILLQAAEQFIENLNIILHRSHYEVSGSLNENGDEFAIIFSVQYTGSEEETMPTVELGFDRYLNQDDHEMWAAVPTLTFPTLSYSIENDYADTIQYHVDQWARLSENITDINRSDFDFTDFSEQSQDNDEVLTSTDVDIESDDELAEEAERLTGMDVAELSHLVRESNDLDIASGSATITKLELVQNKNRVNVTVYLEGYDDNSGEYIDDEFVITLPVIIRNESDDVEASYEYDDESEETQWKELSSKTVPDSDGFYTDYTLYESLDPESTGCAYICMFGDRDIYTPDESYADMTFDDLGEAEDWFHSYTGFADDDDIMLATDVGLSLDDTQVAKVYDISERYSVSNPVSGDWSTEIDHLKNAIMTELGLSEEDAKSAMIEYLGFTSDMFDEDEDEFVDLTPEMFYSFFDATVDDETKDLAAKILCKWYMLEGAEELPTKTDILDMVDAADSEEDAAIVLTALGKF